jgi:uncharacterized protein with HEPN domain
MRRPDRVEDYLEHMADAITRATHYLQDIDNFADFQQDQRSQDAVVRNIEIIGEAAAKIQKLAPDFIAEHGELPWAQMRAMHGFRVLAMLTACVGLYETTSYNVARQIGEIGIRMALGAQRGAVVWMVLRRVLLLAAVGLAISVPAALIASRLVKSFLFETRPNDPGTLALAGIILVSATILAGDGPARRASRIDPLAALRQE